MEDNIVDNPNDQHDPLPFADHLYSQRETIRECLNSLAADVGVALRQCGLHLSGLPNRSEFWELARNCRHAY